MDAVIYASCPALAPELLVRPSPLLGEGLQGYLLRVAETNCLSISELAQLGVYYDPAGLVRDRLLPDQASNPELFAYVVRMSRGLANAGRVWNRHYVRFCPCCLAEEPFWRAGWEIYFHDVCPRHGVWLIDRCRACGDMVRWQRDSLLQCQCGHDLRQETTSVAPENPRRLSAILEARLLGIAEPAADAPLAGLDVEQVQRLIRYFGGYMDPGSGAKPLKLRNSGRMVVSWSVTTLAAEILFNWPHAFHHSLNRLQETITGEKTGLRGLFRFSYQYLYKGFKEAAFDPVRQAFECWLAACWKGGLARRNRRLPGDLLAVVQWIPGKVAADSLNISLPRLRHLVREGNLDGQESVSTTGRRFLVVRRNQLEQIRAQLANEMTLSEAMKVLAIGKVRMQRLIQLLFPSARRTHGEALLPWRVPRTGVEELLAIGAHLPVVSILDEHHVSLAYVLKHWNWSANEIVELVEAVKGGRLVPQAMLDSAHGISRWVFESAHLRPWQHRLATRLPNWLSIPELARVLDVKQEVAYWITRNGLIPSERLSSLKRSGVRVRWENIERYRQTYVFGREIAEILHRSPKKTMQLLAEQGIHPVLGHDALPCRQLIYIRCDELQHYLAQTTGASPGAFRLVRSPSAEELVSRIISFLRTENRPLSDS